MKVEIIDILRDYRDGWLNLDSASDKILSLMSENTGGVSTSSRTESGVSHGVSDRNASRSDSDEASEEVVGGTLALRTEAKEFKYCDCVEPDRNRGSNICLRCGYPIEC